MKNYYEILGVDRNATLKEIKKAYRDKVKRTHIDSKAQENLSEEEIKILNAKLHEICIAYKTLSDPDKRSDYEVKLLVNEFLKMHSKVEKEEIKNKKSEEEISCEDVQSRPTLKEIYQEVKEEEKENSFSKRHSILNKRIKKAYPKKENSNLINEFVISFGKGTIHIGHELFYRIDKFKNSFKDPMPKFVIKNRYLLSTLGVVVAMNIISKNIDLSTPSIDSINLVTEALSDEDNEIKTEDNLNYPSEKTVLTRIYKIKEGDTLYSLATSSGNNPESIRKINNLSSDEIYVGDYLYLPYEVSASNLKYYTKTINVKDKSLYEIAEKYETDLETICTLNKETIEIINQEKGLNTNIYYTTANTIIVPNFISISELSKLKSEDILKHIK